MTSGMLASSLGMGTLLVRDSWSLLARFARLGCLLIVTEVWFSTGKGGACGTFIGDKWGRVMEDSRVEFAGEADKVTPGNIGGRGGASCGGGGMYSGTGGTSECVGTGFSCR